MMYRHAVPPDLVEVDAAAAAAAARRGADARKRVMSLLRTFRDRGRILAERASSSPGRPMRVICSSCRSGSGRLALRTARDADRYAGQMAATMSGSQVERERGRSARPDQHAGDRRLASRTSEEGRALMREKKSYVFFRGDRPGPLGALGLPVTPRATSPPIRVRAARRAGAARARPARASGLWIAQDTAAQSRRQPLRHLLGRRRGSRSRRRRNAGGHRPPAPSQRPVARLRCKRPLTLRTSSPLDKVVESFRPYRRPPPAVAEPPAAAPAAPPPRHRRVSPGARAPSRPVHHARRQGDRG